MTLENNWFAAPVGTTGQSNGTALASSGVNANLTIRNNSFNAAISLDDNGRTPPTGTSSVRQHRRLPMERLLLARRQLLVQRLEGPQVRTSDVNLGGGALPYRKRGRQLAGLPPHGGAGQRPDPAGRPCPPRHRRRGAPAERGPGRRRRRGGGRDDPPHSAPTSTPTSDPEPPANPEPSPTPHAPNPGTAPTREPPPTPEPPPTATAPNAEPPPSPVPPPPSGRVFLSPSGVDSAACSKVDPCRTLSRGLLGARRAKRWSCGGRYITGMCLRIRRRRRLTM